MEFPTEQQQQSYQYDSSQYDHQSAASYYAYVNQQHQQQYQYYPPQDPFSQQYLQFYQDPATMHPPGVPLDQSLYHNQPAVYYPPQHPVLPVPGSDSAPATASFVGNNPPHQIQTAYRGGRRGGRRGCRPFRGGGRGHAGSGNRGIRPDGSAPHCRDNHSGSRHFASTGVTSAISNSVSDPSAAVMPPSALVPGQATLPPQVPAAPVWPPPRMAWCELCRVDCNRLEILEQHKNGKRHKKNLKLQEEMRKLNKVNTPLQSVQVPNTGSEVAQSKKVEGSEEKQHQQDALSSLPTTDDKEKETEQQKDIINKSEASTNRKLNGPSEARGCGIKRKMKGGRGGKYMKSNEGPRKPVEPPKPVGGIPFFCELCNVKCESQVVVDSHLSGKKHIANMKKFQGHKAVYGEKGLQALYPPNLNAPSSSFIPQIQQDLTDPQVVLAQLLTYVLSQAQFPVSAAVPQVPLPAATSQIPLSSSEMQHPLQFTQGSYVTSETSREVSLKADAEAPPFAGNNKGECQTSESEKNDVSQQQAIVASAGTDVKVEDGALVLENKPVISPIDNPICATSSTSEKDAKTEPGSSNNLEEPGKG